MEHTNTGPGGVLSGASISDEAGDRAEAPQMAGEGQQGKRHQQKKQKPQPKVKKGTEEGKEEEEKEEELQTMTMDEVEAAFAAFAEGEGEGAASHTRQFTNLNREQRARLHDLADALGFVHFSFGSRKRRVLVLVRNPRPITPGVYDPHAEQWRPATLVDGPSQLGHVIERAEGDGDSEDGAVQLKVVSYNVLMDANPDLCQYPIEDLLYTEHRWPALLKIIEHERADIIALQEGTAKFLEQLLQEEWVRRGYYISDYSGNSVSPMGNIILSRYPFAIIEERMYRQDHGMPKSVLLGVIAVGHLRISVAAVHLKAGTGFASTRNTQIEQTMDMQEAHEADGYLLLGDLNMRSIEKEANARLDATYVDLWQAVHGPIEPGHSDGFTFDLARNTTARLISERVTAIKRTIGYSSRFDRICFRSPVPIVAPHRPASERNGTAGSGSWEVGDMRMLGTEAVASAPSGVEVFPSDHFGLTTTLRRISD